MLAAMTAAPLRGFLVFSLKTLSNSYKPVVCSVEGQVSRSRGQGIQRGKNVASTTVSQRDGNVSFMDVISPNAQRFFLVFFHQETQQQICRRQRFRHPSNVRG